MTETIFLQKNRDPADTSFLYSKNCHRYKSVGFHPSSLNSDSDLDQSINI